MGRTGAFMLRKRGKAVSLVAVWRNKSWRWGAGETTESMI